LGHSKIVSAALALLLVAGCANVRWAIQKSFRSPGEHLSDFPEAVWEEYDCATQRRPFFVIERNELLPPRVKAGGSFGHRMIYAMCPERPTGVVSGRLHTRIRFRGDPIVRDTTEDYEVKPGRWVVDAEVQLPEDAEPGVYAYEVSFEGRRLSFEKSLTFVVQEP
jgi:hypothetical protein